MSPASNGFIYSFWDWWSAELASLVPAPLRRPFGTRHPTLALQFDDDRVTVSRRGSGKPGHQPVVDVGALEPGPARAAVHKAISRVRGGRSAPALLISPATAIRKSVKLPLAAAENLYEVLGYEMDRHTPFTADEVYYAYKTVATDRENSQVTVELAVAPRTVVDRAIARAKEWGLVPATVGVARDGDDPGEDFRFALNGQSRPRSRVGRYLNLCLLLIAIALGAALAYLPLERLRDRSDELARTVHLMKTEAREATELNSEIETLMAQRQFGLNKKRERMATVVVLDKLTRLLPDDTWLFQVQIRDGETQIQGYSTEAARLVGLIENSPDFKEVSLRSRVIRDTRFDAERFHISFQLMQGE